MGEVDNAIVEVMFESGSAVSLLRKSDTNQVDVYSTARATRVRLTTATSEPLPVVRTEQLPMQVGDFKNTLPFCTPSVILQLATKVRAKHWQGGKKSTIG